MKRLVSIIVIVTAALFAADALAAGLPSDDERLSAGGIIKDIQTPEDSIYALVDVEAVIRVDPKTLWATLIDIEKWPLWLPMNRRAWFISEEAERQITPETAKDKAKVYEIDKKYPQEAKGNSFEGKWARTVIEEYDLIWPLRDEWVIRRYSFDDTSSPFTASWKKVSSTDGEIDGKWEIGPWKDANSSLLKYYYRVKVKEGVPKPVFRTAVGFTVNSMIKSLRREVVKRTESR